MTLSLTLACLWVLTATVMTMIPSNDSLWRRAYVLIAVGIPILIGVFIQNGAIVGFLVLAAGMSVLRWPVRYGLRWLRNALTSAS